MNLQALPGFRDFYPPDFARRAWLFALWRRVARVYGFEEYDGPPLEPLQLYTAKSGDEIVTQLYAFEDKGGRDVALRPEMTPTLARMVAARANGLKKPIRWFAIPQLFRYERQQRGRLREHFQLNCDIIGETGAPADAEIIALAVDVMRGAGLTRDDVRVRISDRRLLAAVLQDRGVAESQLGAAFAAIDKAERSDRSSLATTLQHAGLDTQQIDALFDVCAVRGWDEVQLLAGSHTEQALVGIDEVLQSLGARGMADFVEVDLTIVRGLAYYTGTVFELFDAQRSHRAICGGGRYDALLKAMGGPDLPAAGFGMGDVVLSDILDEKGLFSQSPSRLDVFLVAVTEAVRPQALALVQQLRSAGVATEFALAEATVSRQMKLAGSRGARLAVILGPDEVARSEARWRNLASGEEGACAAGDVVSMAQRLTHA